MNDLVRVIEPGKSYKITDILPIDTILLLVFEKQWKLSEKLTQVSLYPYDYQNVNYTLPIDLSSWFYLRENPPMYVDFKSEVCDLFLYADYDSRRYWKIGYAPEIDVLFFGVGDNGKLCFPY